MEKGNRKKLLLAAGMSLGLLGSLGTEAASGVTYTGDTTDTQHAQSVGANASSPGAYADVTMDYTIPDVVAIGVYTTGEITSTDGAPLLAGRFTQNSDLSITDEAVILNDIVSSTNTGDFSTDSDYLAIRGAVYSSSGLALLTVEPIVEGSSASSLLPNFINAQFTNQTNSGSFDVAFSAVIAGSASPESFTGDSSSIANVGGTILDSSNQGVFRILGDVQEDTVTNADDTGVYEGGVRVTVTSL